MSAPEPCNCPESSSRRPDLADLIDEMARTWDPKDGPMPLIVTREQP